MITVRIPVENIATVLATYTTIRVYRDTSPDGAFTTLAGSITLVAGQTLYALSDASGDANSIYQHEYYNTVSLAVSPRSPSYYAGGTTLLRLRLEGARGAGAAFSGTCSADGTTTTLVDANLADEGLDTAFLEGSWIYRPNAAAFGDKVRRVKKDGFTVAASSLGVDRVYTNFPVNGEVYHIFNFFPPIDRPGSAISWDRVVRDGLALVWFPDRVNLGLGDGTNPRITLSAFPDINENTIRGVIYTNTDSNGVIHEVYMDRMGLFWTYIRNDQNGPLSLDMSLPARTDQSRIIEAVRRETNMYRDTDVTLAPFEAAKRAITYVAYRTLNMLQPGKYAGELAMAANAWQLERDAIRVGDVVLGV